MTQTTYDPNREQFLVTWTEVSNSSQIKAESHFANDLGLDSLDTVEVVMAIEEEFSIEIPDKDADSIHSGTFPLTFSEWESLGVYSMLTTAQ